MFDFHNLNVYKKAKESNHNIFLFLKRGTFIDKYLQDQLKRASISVVINIAEGSGKLSKPDRRNFYTIARGSVYECVSLLEIIEEEYSITKGEEIKDLKSSLEEISKMLFGLIRSQK
ncbi:MAG: four helix bundle protein [Patescibacteria group bacterium]